MQELIQTSLHAMQHLVENRVDDFLEASIEENGYVGRNEMEIRCLIDKIRQCRDFIEKAVDMVMTGPLMKMLGLESKEAAREAILSGQIQLVPVHPDHRAEIQKRMEEQGMQLLPPIDPEKAN